MKNHKITAAIFLVCAGLNGISAAMYAATSRTSNTAIYIGLAVLSLGASILFYTLGNNNKSEK